MRLPASLSLLALASCADSADITTRQARPGALDPSGDTDSDADTDTDTDTDSDTDTDTDTDADTTWVGDDTTTSPVTGIDVSRWNGYPEWDQVAADGFVFAIVKATESDYYTSVTFADQYDGAADQGLIRGAYHFAVPDDTDGATQATFFVENGGDWSPDGQTLPGVLDIEYNPYGQTCYDMSKSEMVDWVTDFVDTYIALTGRAPMIYSNADWWNTCVGSSDIPDVVPLWVAYWSSGTPTLPGGWSDYTFWQYSAEGAVGGISGDVDLNRFPGSLHDLRMFANDTY
jgi:GH25 family lysozyme M1 (1,4-beta-N-acetylmuramidase)